jgi:hypothetical protein
MQGLHPPSSPVYLRPCRFCLVDPQDHVHGPVQGEGCGKRRARQLLLAFLGIQRAELSTAIEMYQTMEMTFWLPQAEAALCVGS